MRKRMFVFVMALVMLLTCFIGTGVTASAYATSGTQLGVDWKLENGVLTLSPNTAAATPGLLPDTDQNAGEDYSTYPWNNEDKRADITKVVIAGKIILPSTCIGLFNNMSNVTAFVGLENLETQDEVNKLCTAKYMFRNCSKVTELDLSGVTFTISTATTSNMDLTGMFSGCSSLKTIYVSETSWASDLGSVGGDDMFTGCTSLVGGAGTKYSSDHVNRDYAFIDGSTFNGNIMPGYLTNITAKPESSSEPESSGEPEASGSNATLDDSTTTTTVTQPYTITSSDDSGYEDKVCVKVSWDISPIAATYKLSKTWDSANMTWVENKGDFAITSKAATFTFTNYSTLKIGAKVEFAAEASLGDILAEDSFKSESVLLDTAVNADKTVDTNKTGANIPTATVSAELKFDNDAFAALGVTDSAETLGTYTITVSSKCNVTVEYNNSAVSSYETLIVPVGTQIVVNGNNLTIGDKTFTTVQSFKFNGETYYFAGWEEVNSHEYVQTGIVTGDMSIASDYAQ